LGASRNASGTVPAADATSRHTWATTFRADSRWTFAPSPSRDDPARIPRTGRIVRSAKYRRVTLTRPFTDEAASSDTTKTP
jgi:hypothetical protein